MPYRRLDRRRIPRHVLTAVTLIIMAVLIIVLLTACSDDGPSAAEQASNDRNKAVEQIREKQRVAAMKFSPTLETVNRWAETWGQEGKVAYVYMQRQDGTFAGYYAVEGLPVNYCVSGSPTYDLIDSEGDGDSYKDREVPAPGLDGAYYGNCDPSRYYAFDAVTGQYLEWTDGRVLTAVVSDQPLPLDKQPQPFGSSIEEVKNR